MGDRTVTFRPFAGERLSIVGSEHDAGVVGELARSGGLYQRDVSDLLRRLVRPDAVAVDGGAHIGVVTTLLARLAPAGAVHAFEPVPENRGHLVANLAANRIANVTVSDAALWRCDGEIALRFDAAAPGGSHVGTAGAGGGVVTAPAVRLDTWVAASGLERLDLVKLDVEGAEIDVLAGAGETLRRFRPVLVVEANPVALARFGRTRVAGLWRRLRAYAPVVGRVGAGGAVVPLLSPAHLDLALRRRGVIDLVALPDAAAPTPRPAARAVRAAGDLARLGAAQNRWRPPPTNFVVDPTGIGLTPIGEAVAGHPAETVRVPVEIRNGSRAWLSSGFPCEPVHVSYRWLDGGGNRIVAEGHRTPFPEPLRPGRAVRLDVTVQLPAQPGRHQLVLTLVQEHFAWLDEIDPACCARLPGTVLEP